MPDDFFKKLPKLGLINFGTAKVHSCGVTYYLYDPFIEDVKVVKCRHENHNEESLDRQQAKFMQKQVW